MPHENGTSAAPAAQSSARANVGAFFSTENLPDVNLDALLDVAGHVTLKGVRHQVLDIDGAGVQAIQQAIREKKGDDLLGIYRSIVRRATPSISAEEHATLTMKQITAIMAICAHNVDAIEALEKNDERSTGAKKTTTRRARGGKRQG